MKAHQKSLFPKAWNNFYTGRNSLDLLQFFTLGWEQFLKHCVVFETTKGVQCP
jgi:hypothetical protein